MKILMISPSYGSKIGGAENQLKKLYKKLIVNNEVKIFSKKTAKCSNFLYPINYLFKIFLRIIINQFDIIHVHTFSSPAWFISLSNILLNKIVIIKITLSGNNSRLEKIKKNNFLKILFKIFFFSKKVYFVSINKDIKQDLIKIGIRRENIINIPNGVEIKTGNVNKNKNIDIIFFGRLIKRKNLTELIKIINNYKLFNIKFVIYGEGPERRYLIHYIKKNQIKNIFIRKFISNSSIINKLQYSKFSINASHSEGLSNSILESLSQGVPVICRDISQNKLLIKNNFNGYLYTNQKDLLKILTKINNKKINYKIFSKNCFETAKKYNMEHISNLYTEKYLQIYSKN
jgi:glycosyltransferase involved in cell wall biosynthesis